MSEPNTGSADQVGIPIELQQVLDAAQLVVREFDGTILHWTRAMEHLYGWPRQEAIGHNSHQLLRTIFPQPLVDIEAQLIDEGQWAGELIRRRRDGERVVSASHWSLRGHTVVEVCNDVTRQRREYDALQHLANIVNSSDDAIIGKSFDGVITSWNQGARCMFGYTADEVIGRPITILFPPDSLDEEVAIMEKIRHGRRVEHFETFRRSKDGADIPVSLTISPIISTDGQIIGASKIMRDISERHQGEAKLQELQTKLFHLSRLNTVSYMASGLAHELNQPLSAISNYLGGATRLLGDRTDNISSTLMKALTKASEQVARSGEIIRHLRAFMSSGETDFKVESVSQLVNETAQLALIGAKDRDVKFTFALNPSLDRVCIDKIQVQQVLLNLIRNALEAMEHSERRELTIASAVAEFEMVEISVKDTGRGIPPNVAAQLFEPFVTTKRQGMGVGLSISKTIIEAHGGQIRVELNAAEGTTFLFTLPLVTEPAD